jgi:NADPH2:quinone reductase
MKAIQIHETGGPGVLKLADLPIPEPGPGQVLIRVEATGVNFIEIYFRKGVYKAALPLILGSEAAGTVEELGPGVTGFAAGDAVASTRINTCPGPGSGMGKSASFRTPGPPVS